MAKSVEVSLDLNLPQWRAWAAIAPRRTVFLGWGRGVGKSWFRRQVWWSKIAEHEHRLRATALKPFKGFRVTSLASTLKQWKDIHWGGIEQELLPGGEWAHLKAHLDAQSGQIWFPGGGVVRPFPATAYNARTARGMRTDLLDADEVDDIDADVYDSIAVPWLSEPWSYGLELPGGTPTRGRHGLWWRFLAAGNAAEKLRTGEMADADALQLPATQAILSIFSELPKEHWPPGLSEEPEQAALSVLRNYYSLHATYRDAPETVSPLAVARAKATTPGTTFQREWEANADAGEGLVYPFDEAFHVRPEPHVSTFTEFHVGMDHGWVDAGVLLLIGIQGHGRDATAWVLDEWYESEVPNHVWNERALDWARDYNAKFWPDPSRPDRIADLKSAGIRVGETDNSLHGGIARVADMVFRRASEYGNDWSRLYVAAKCTNTIREFGLYRRKKRSDGTFDDEPEDKNNHAMDALRYAVVGRFGRAENYRNVSSGR